MTLPHRRHIVKTTYFCVRGYLFLLRGIPTYYPYSPTFREKLSGKSQVRANLLTIRRIIAA